MLVFPPAKINIGLYVESKREDGYHNIASVFYPIPLCDALEISENDTIRCNIHGNAIPGNVENNLVIKAYNLLHKYYNIPPVNIDLIKRIPTGAGLGGGSSNATFTIHALNSICKLNLNTSTIADLSKQIGADCPFFAYQHEQHKPAYITGIGDVVEVLPSFLKGKYVVIVNADIHISTKEAFSNITIEPIDYDIKKLVTNSNISSWKNKITNVFEASVFDKYPVLSEIKETLYNLGANYASMTGSGSSIYGIFDELIDENKLPEGGLTSHLLMLN